MFTQIAKMWWMFTWRLIILFALTDMGRYIALGSFLALVGAIALAVTGRTIRTWPVIKLFRGLNPLYRFEKASKRRVSSPDVPIDHTNVITQASNRGVMTGFEPKNLINTSVAFNPKVYGNPGAGLASSGFNQNAISLGQAGELNFAKALSLHNGANGVKLIRSFETFWSVAMPSSDNPWTPDRQFNTDIDAIILVNDTIYLIDLKNYSGGDVIYQTSGEYFVTYDRLTGSHVGQPKHMSRNMAMATERFQKHFPNMKIESRVVLMPTDKGEGTVDRAFWPGGIPAVNLRTFLNEISGKSPKPISSKARNVIDTIPNLLKK